MYIAGREPAAVCRRGSRRAWAAPSAGGEPRAGGANEPAAGSPAKGGAQEPAADCLCMFQPYFVCQRDEIQVSF